MPVSLRFRCQYCDERPDPLTQLSLVTAMRETTFGAYQDALPGRWLIFHGRGLLGPPRYACAAHRGDLVAFLREHYGAVGSQVWRRRPIRRASRTPTSTGRGGPPRPARPAGSDAAAARPARERRRAPRRTAPFASNLTGLEARAGLLTAGGTTPAFDSGVARCGFAGQSQPPDLAAEHLQGPEKSVTDTDHLLSLVRQM